MASTSTALRLEPPTAAEMADSPATRAAQDFANSPAMRILREWSIAPDIEALAGGDRQAPSEPARK